MKDGKEMRHNVRVAMLSLCMVMSVSTFGIARGTLVRSPRAVPGAYIVVLDKTVNSHASDIALDVTMHHGGHVTSVFERTFKGFTVNMTEQQARAMLNDARVHHIEEDTALELAATTQPIASEGLYDLDRIDQR